MVATSVLRSEEVPVPNLGAAIMQVIDRQQAYKQKEQQQEQDKIKMVADQLDWKNFATGTVLDPVINENVNGLLQKYSERIKNNKGEGMSSLMFDLSRDLQPVNDYRMKAQLVRQNIEGAVTEYGKESKVINASSLKNMAFANAFLKTDPNTGQVTFKGADEIDPNADYTSSIIATRPEAVGYDNPTALFDYLKGLKTNKPGGKSNIENKGVTDTYNWTADLHDFEELVTDKNGQVVGSRVKRDADPLIIGKQELPMLPAEDFSRHFGSNGDLRFTIQGLTNKMIGGAPVTKEEREKIMRHVAYKYLQGVFPDNANFKKEAGRDESATVVKNYFPGSGGGGGSKGSDADVKSINLYESLKKRVDDARSKGAAILANALPSDEQILVADMLKRANYDLTPDKYFLYSTDEGVGVYKVKSTGGKKEYLVTNDNRIMLISANDFNVRANQPLGQKAKQQVVQQQQQQGKKTIRRSDIQAKANAAGYTIEEYEKLLRERNIEIVN